MTTARESDDSIDDAIGGGGGDGAESVARARARARGTWIALDAGRGSMCGRGCGGSRVDGSVGVGGEGARARAGRDGGRDRARRRARTAARARAVASGSARGSRGGVDPWMWMVRSRDSGVE